MSRGFKKLDDLILFACKTGDRVGMKLVARHEYGHLDYSAPWNEKGNIVVLRFEHPTRRRDNGKPVKAITQAHLGNDGLWHVGLPKREDSKGALERPVYRLDDVLAARENGAAFILLLEGEKAVDAAATLGVPACCTLGGAGAWKRTDLEPIAASSWRVVVCGSEDKSGRKYEDEVGAHLRDLGADVRLLRLPGLRPNSGDDLVEHVSDRRAQGLGDVEIAREIEELAEQSPPLKASAVTKSGRRAKPVLAELAIEACNLFHDQELESYASFDVNGHRETWPVRSRPFKMFVGKLAFDVGLPGGRQSVENAIESIAATALYSDDRTREVHRRWAWHHGRLLYDLCDQEWRVVEAGVDATGVAGLRVLPTSECPVAFVRSPGAMPQAMPADGGSFDDLKHLTNLDDESWTILRGFLVAVFLPVGELPVLEVSGEENSGKSWVTEMISDLTDPTRTRECSMPREIRDLYVRAQFRRVLTLGNVSSITPEISDALCRLTTGVGIEERAYYTAHDLDTYTARCAVVLNGIGRHVTRSDLTSRTLHVETLPITGERQREREWLRREFDARRAGVFGLLLRAVAVASVRRDQVILHERPRLLDAARLVDAAAPLIGLEPGEWPRLVVGQRAAASRDLIEDSPLGRAVRTLAEREGTWTGSATELLGKLERPAVQVGGDDYWPKSSRKLSADLTRLARPLRDVGVVVERARRTDHSKPAQTTIRVGNPAEKRAEQAGHAAAGERAPEAPAYGGDASESAHRPDTRRDTPMTGRDRPDNIGASPGIGASGASGASPRSPAGEDEELVFDPASDDGSPS
jgi:hypothetical protein